MSTVTPTDSQASQSWVVQASDVVNDVGSKKTLNVFHYKETQMRQQKAYTVTAFTGLALFAMLFPAIGLPVLGASVAISGALVADDIIHQNRLEHQRRREWVQQQQQPLLIYEQQLPETQRSGVLAAATKIKKLD